MIVYVTNNKEPWTYKGLAQRVIELGMTKVMAVRVEEMTPLREELDSSKDWEEESYAV